MCSIVLRIQPDLLAVVVFAKVRIFAKQLIQVLAEQAQQQHNEANMLTTYYSRCHAHGPCSSSVRFFLVDPFTDCLFIISVSNPFAVSCSPFQTPHSNMSPHNYAGLKHNTEYSCQFMASRLHVLCNTAI